MPYLAVARRLGLSCVCLLRDANGTNEEEDKKEEDGDGDEDNDNDQRGWTPITIMSATNQSSGRFGKEGHWIWQATGLVHRVPRVSSLC